MFFLAAKRLCKLKFGVNKDIRRTVLDPVDMGDRGHTYTRHLLPPFLISLSGGSSETSPVNLHGTLKIKILDNHNCSELHQNIRFLG